MIIIGIAGKLKAGKDTLCEMARKQIKAPSARVAFADSLKEEVSRACGVGVSFVETHKDIFRPMLQWWGTDFRRQLCRDTYWIDQLHSKLCELLDQKTAIVFISDVRFRNEAEYIKKMGGEVWVILRPEYQPPQAGNIHAHASENDMNGFTFDYVVHNHGSLTDLCDSTKVALKELNGRIRTRNLQLCDKL